MALCETREAVARLLAQGVPQAVIARRLDRSKSTIAYHVRRLGLPVDERFRRRYDWVEVQRFYDQGHSVRECVEHFGFSTETWVSAVRRGDVVARPVRRAIAEYLVDGRPRTSRSHLKRRLLEEGLLEERCAACGVSDWCGRPLVLALHHRNGVGRDNRLDNLELLCPNCHSQTENFAGRNKRRVTPPAARADRPEGGAM